MWVWATWCGSGWGFFPPGKHHGGPPVGWIQCPDGAPYVTTRSQRTEWNVFGLNKPEEESFVWPTGTTAAVLASFKAHSLLRESARIATSVPTEEETAYCKAVFLNRHRLRYTCPTLDLYSSRGREQFDRALAGLNKKAGPGLGAFQRNATIGSALGWDGQQFDPSAVEQLRGYVQAKLTSLGQGGTPDDIRAFIKDEPHKRTKVRDRRFRLIMVMSLEDQMVDRILFQEWSAVESDNVMSIPGKSGWSPLPFGYRLFDRAFPGKTLATDCSAFDWTVPEWAVAMLMDLRLEMVVPDDGFERYAHAVRARFRQVLGPDCVIRLPDGQRLSQERYGLMKSGWFRTIAENSAIQVLTHSLAWMRSHPGQYLPNMWTMGDDVVMGWSDLYDQACFERALATTGVLVKHGLQVREFAGFRFGRGCVSPLYPEKHAFMLRFVPPDMKEQIADSYQLFYSLADRDDRAPLDRVFAASRIAPYLAAMWARGGSFALSA
uniref:RNA-directed RNA polymerase n=1 Tax=Wifsystermes virus TaxID=2796640 RepID=A0A7T7GUT4_9VIRU|nr:putative replicase [Wifsystermes virus]